MTETVIYLLKVNLGIMVLYGLYIFFLRRDTFFKLRRWVLIFSIVLSFIYPLIEIPAFINVSNAASEGLLTVMLPDILVQNHSVETSNTAIATISASDIAGLLYWTGIVLLTIYFIIRCVSLLNMALDCRHTKLCGRRVCRLEGAKAPFSFFKWIFISPDNHTEKEIEEIMTHEQAHADGWHSVDRLLAEIMCILCWPNPLAWMMKREVADNLEYLTDEHVLAAGHDARTYQFHLLRLASGNNMMLSVANSFKVLPLKNRIIMMNKKRTEGFMRTKYLLLLPATALLIAMGGSCTSKKSDDTKAAENTPATKVETPQTTPATPEAEPVAPKVNVEGEIFTVVETMPEFPGGQTALLNYLAKSIKYPTAAQENGIQGRVTCSFVITKDGKIVNAEVMRGVDPELDAEALRVINAMPNWTPGKQKGKPVNVKYTVPVTYRLQ